MTEATDTNFDARLEAVKTVLRNFAPNLLSKDLQTIDAAIEASSSDAEALLQGIHEAVLEKADPGSPAFSLPLKVLAGHFPLIEVMARGGLFGRLVESMLATAKKKGERAVSETAMAFLHPVGMPVEAAEARRDSYSRLAQQHPADVGAALGLILKEAHNADQVNTNRYLHNPAFLGALAGLNEYGQPLPDAPKIWRGTLMDFVRGLLIHQNPPEQGLATYATAAQAFLEQEEGLLDALAVRKPEALDALLYGMTAPLVKDIRKTPIPDTEADLKAKRKLAGVILKGRGLRGLARTVPEGTSAFLVSRFVEPNGIFRDSPVERERVIRRILVESPRLMQALLGAEPRAAATLVTRGYQEVQANLPFHTSIIVSAMNPRRPLASMIVFGNDDEQGNTSVHLGSTDAPWLNIALTGTPAPDARTLEPAKVWRKLVEKRCRKWEAKLIRARAEMTVGQATKRPGKGKSPTAAPSLKQGS